jgi:hypothetical protein
MNMRVENPKAHHGGSRWRGTVTTLAGDVAIRWSPIQTPAVRDAYALGNSTRLLTTSRSHENRGLLRNVHAPLSELPLGWENQNGHDREALDHLGRRESIAIRLR